MKTLRVAGIKPESMVDGPGVRFVLFLQGCPLACLGCHNPEARDPAGGAEMAAAEIRDLIARARYIDGVTFSGGEPFYQAAGLAGLAVEIRRLGLSLVLYSGYTWEELAAAAGRDEAVARLLAAGDILVDGPYREAERDLSLPFRNSRNQRLLDLPRSLAQGRPVPYFLPGEALSS